MNRVYTDVIILLSGNNTYHLSWLEWRRSQLDPLTLSSNKERAPDAGETDTFARRLPESCVFVPLQTSGLVHKKKSREYAIIEWCTRPDTRQTKLLALVLHLSYKTRVKFLPFITILLKTTKLLKVLLKFLNVAFTSCAFTFCMFDYISGVTCRSPNTVHYLL